MREVIIWPRWQESKAQNQEQAYQKLPADGMIREITSVFNVEWSDDFISEKQL